jgi:hypothetical protein
MAPEMGAEAAGPRGEDDVEEAAEETERGVGTGGGWLG